MAGVVRFSDGSQPAVLARCLEKKSRMMLFSAGDWDINEISDTTSHQVVGYDEFEDWPDGESRRVYPPSLENARKHSSGWAMRNTNNHNVTILKKSCLGVVVCSLACVYTDGSFVHIRPAICDKARRKQCGKPCPNPACQGKLQVMPCRGHQGYPVTHFWKHTANATYFQGKGRHCHPRPEAKSSSDSKRTQTVTRARQKTTRSLTHMSSKVRATKAHKLHAPPSLQHLSPPAVDNKNARTAVTNTSNLWTDVCTCSATPCCCRWFPPDYNPTPSTTTSGYSSNSVTSPTQYQYLAPAGETSGFENNLYRGSHDNLPHGNHDDLSTGNHDNPPHGNHDNLPHGNHDDRYGGNHDDCCSSHTSQSLMGYDGVALASREEVGERMPEVSFTARCDWQQSWPIKSDYTQNDHVMLDDHSTGDLTQQFYVQELYPTEPHEVLINSYSGHENVAPIEQQYQYYTSQHVPMESADWLSHTAQPISAQLSGDVHDQLANEMIDTALPYATPDFWSNEYNRYDPNEQELQHVFSTWNTSSQPKVLNDIYYPDESGTIQQSSDKQMYYHSYEYSNQTMISQQSRNWSEHEIAGDFSNTLTCSVSCEPLLESSSYSADTKLWNDNSFMIT